MIKTVLLTKSAKRDLATVPDYIAAKFALWVASVELQGLEAVRKIPGFHDEPLKGDRKGQRSIRLNKAYRAIYVVTNDGKIELVEVREVNKHEY